MEDYSNIYLKKMSKLVVKINFLFKKVFIIHVGKKVVMKKRAISSFLLYCENAQPLYIVVT